MPDAWVFIPRLATAVALTAAIGLEREIRRKDAGLRTNTLVGLAAALVMLVSQYGFSDVLSVNRIMLDPSRIAAQVVSGIGFLGGGLIFVRRDVVRGLTTAAGVWLSAAIGLASGAGLLGLAAVTAVFSILVVQVFDWVERELIRSKHALTELKLLGRDETGVLASVLAVLASDRTDIFETSLHREADRPGMVDISITLRGTRPSARALEAIGRLEGIVSVTHSPERPLTP